MAQETQPLVLASSSMTQAAMPVVNALLQFASTASFAIPVVGALIGGGIQLLQSFIGMFCPGGQDMAQALAKELGQITEELLNQQVVTQATSLFTTEANDLQMDLQAMAQEESANLASTALKYAASYREDCRDDHPLQIQMNNLTTSAIMRDLSLAPQAFQALTAGVGLFLTKLRLVVQYQANAPLPTGADAATAVANIYDDYVRLREQTNLWASKLVGLASGIVHDRLALLQDHYSLEETSIFISDSNIIPPPAPYKNNQGLVEIDQYPTPPRPSGRSSLRPTRPRSSTR